MAPYECIAREEYERVRGCAAFRIARHVAKHANQYAVRYRFPDESCLIVYTLGPNCGLRGVAYCGSDGMMYARRIA